jgi:hypothetical protein
MKQLQHSSEKEMKHLEHSHCNMRLKQMKHFVQTPATYVYYHYNMCNIRKLPFHHPYETSEIFETCILQHREGRGQSIPGVGWEPTASGEVRATSTSTNSGTRATDHTLAPALA